MKNIFIERQKDVLRIAIIENGRLISCFIEEEDNGVYPGQLYKAVVKNIVPAIKCAFVDIGTDKNAYMYLDSKFNNKSIKKGDELIVEVVKESIGTKGPKVTSAISIPGRYTVIQTIKNSIDISKKINNSEFESEIRSKLKKPEDVGIVIRTNAEKVTIEEINSEIEELYCTYKDVIKKGTFSNKPKLLYNSGGSLGKVLRDILDETTERIIVNTEEDYITIKKILEALQEVNSVVELHTDNISIMEYYGIEKEIGALRNNTLELACGGSIIIEKTEAMYVIDVNSGKNVRAGNIEKTAAITNLQAAEEIVRQIILRNLSGIIVIDFIDIDDLKIQQKIIYKLEEGFKSDKNKTIVYPFTELSLVQIARSRRGKSILEHMEENCYQCKGRGRILKLSYMTYLLRNEIIKIINNKSCRYIYLEINEIYKNNVLKDIEGFVKAIDAENAEVYIKFVKNTDLIKVEPLVFETQRKEKQIYKVYG